VHYDSIISAPVIRAPVEDEYPGWLAATVSRFKALAAPPAYPNLLFMPIPCPYLRRLPILPPSSRANHGWQRFNDYILTNELICD